MERRLLWLAPPRRDVVGFPRAAFADREALHVAHRRPARAACVLRPHARPAEGVHCPAPRCVTGEAGMGRRAGALAWLGADPFCFQTNCLTSTLYNGPREFGFVFRTVLNKAP